MFCDGSWENDACVGYCLMAMEQAGLDDETQEKVLVQLYDSFDQYSLEEAAEYYRQK